jgi:DNA polymerase-3 subunit alpha
MGVEAHTAYALRKTGRAQVKPIHRELEGPLTEILGPTHGLIVYQEQIMRAAQAVAGYSLGKADLLRKAMGKKKPEVLAKEKVPFLAGMKDKGFSLEAAEALWEVFLPFAAYAFNVAHTVSYGFITYQTAWLKAHYPAEFMAALLTVAGDQKRPSYLGECRRMRLSVKVPDVNESGAGFTPTGGTIRFGLNAIKGIGPNVVKAIIDGRADGPYNDFGDFLQRVGPAALTAKAVDALVRAGAFDSLGYARKSLALAAPDAVKQQSAVAKKEAAGQADLFSLFAEVEEAPAFSAVVVPDFGEWEKEARLYTEKDVLGLYVSGHPLDDLEPVLAGNRDISIAELIASERTEGTAVLAGQIMSAEVKVARASGKKYARVVLADLYGEVEVMAFGQSYGMYGHLLVPDAKIRMKVRLDQRSEEEGVTIICDAVAALDHNLTAAPRRHRVIDGREGIVLNFPVGKATPERVHELRLMLDRHLGDQPVFVDLVSEDGSRQPLVLPGVGVTRSPEFDVEAKALLGLGAMAA